MSKRKDNKTDNPDKEEVLINQKTWSSIDLIILLSHKYTHVFNTVWVRLDFTCPLQGTSKRPNLSCPSNVNQN